LAVFETKLELFQFLPSLNLEEDKRDRKPDGLFDFYNVSPYIVNNSGGIIANSIFIFLICIVFLLLSACITNYNNAIIEMIFHILRGILIWNFFISYVLSNYQSNILYSGCGLKWYSLESEYGIVNFAVACMFGLFNLGAPIFIFIKITQIRGIRNRENKEEMHVQKELGTLKSKLDSLNEFDRSTKKNFTKKIEEAISIDGVDGDESKAKFYPEDDTTDFQKNLEKLRKNLISIDNIDRKNKTSEEAGLNENQKPGNVDKESEDHAPKLDEELNSKFAIWIILKIIIILKLRETLIIRKIDKFIFLFFYSTDPNTAKEIPSSKGRTSFFVSLWDSLKLKDPRTIGFYDFIILI
jgi:hypothetical protein